MKVEQRMNFGYAIFDITGDITYGNFKELEDAINISIPDNCFNVVLNIERVKYINSSALGWLVKFMTDMKSSGYNLFLMNVNNEIMGLLKLTSTLPYFKIIPDEQTLINKEKRKELDTILERADDDIQ